MNARDPDGIVHAVMYNDTPQDWGKLWCGRLYYWTYGVVSVPEMATIIMYDRPWPGAPTKEPVTCLQCLHRER